MRSFEWFVAWRYLFSRQRRALVSIITMISMAGVTVGVAALIVVIGVMDGADDLLFGKIADIYPHVRISGLSGEEIDVDSALMERLRADPDVEQADAVLRKQAFIQAGSGVEAKKRGIEIIGVSHLAEDNLYNIALSEKNRAEGIAIKPGEIMLGRPLAYGIEAYMGSKALVIATNPVRTAMGPILAHRPLRVMGVFTTNFYDFDANIAFINEATLRKLFRIDADKADYIHVKLADPFQADAFKEKLDLSQYHVTTWSMENGAFFTALKLEKLALFIILMLIILVAAFNIIGTLILMVSEKTREIGVLRALGASEGTVRRIFLLDGILIGLVGTLIGVAIGLTICLLLPLIKFPMPPSIYNFNSLPVEIKPLTVSVIMASSMLVCTMAALFPARQAARLDPVEALRYD
jgi:lipoprotein-releasing system permease protein